LKREDKSSTTTIFARGKSQLSDITAQELEQIANRALKFQKYIFRRAWGVYYAVWAAAIAAFSFAFPVFNAFLPSLPWEVYVAYYGGIGIVAGFASVWIFNNAAKTAKLRRILKPDTKLRLKYRLMGLWWLAFYVIILLAFTYYSVHALTILYAMLISVAIFVYSQLRFSFSTDLPIEGKLAVASYASSALISFSFSLFTQNGLPGAIAWLGTVIVWLFCAMYSLKRAPEELVELSF
jgi:MFS family permease